MTNNNDDMEERSDMDEPQTRQETADAAHTLAQDERSVRSDAVTAQLLAMFQTLQTQMLSHMDREGTVIQGMLTELAALSAKTDRFLAAFPDGDPKSHCEYHELVISTMRDKHDFWKKMRYDLIRWGVFGFALWGLYALWRAFLLGPK